MTHNKDELEILNRLKSGRNHKNVKMPYSELEDWENFFIKENVRLHRNYKRQKENEILMDRHHFEYFV